MKNSGLKQGAPVVKKGIPNGGEGAKVAGKQMRATACVAVSCRTSPRCTFRIVTLGRFIARPAATWAAKEKIPRAGRHAGFQILGWLMGLEPTTTGITILDSTN
jgi:hypothetical protein